jgi:hypothetical protein
MASALKAETTDQAIELNAQKVRKQRNGRTSPYLTTFKCFVSSARSAFSVRSVNSVALLVVFCVFDKIPVTFLNLHGSDRYL